MQIKQYNFDSDITLFNLGDVHRGSKAHDNALFTRAIEYIKTHENTYWLSTGDLLDVNLATGKFFDYDSMALNEEYYALLSQLAEIKNKGLCLVGSNHHKRFDRATGLSIDKLIARELGIDYLGAMGLVNITCGRTSYFTALHHGIGGGRRRGAKSNNAELLERCVPGADIYLEGHTHTYDTWLDEVPYIDRKRGLFSTSVARFAVTGHCMSWDSSYALEKKYEPKPAGFAMLDIKANMAGNKRNKRTKCELFY